MSKRGRLIVGRKIVPGPSLPTGSTATGMEPGSRGTATGLWTVEVNRLGFPFGVLRARVSAAEGREIFRRESTPSRTVQARGPIRGDISTIRNVRATSLGNPAVRFDVEHTSFGICETTDKDPGRAESPGHQPRAFAPSWTDSAISRFGCGNFSRTDTAPDRSRRSEDIVDHGAAEHLRAGRPEAHDG